jgi:hypothetical protein
MTMEIKSLKHNLHIAPLAILRIAFGAVMFISTARFILNGWVKDFYISPRFHFPFYGFEWVQPFNSTGMYIVYGCMLIAALFMALGLFYRIAVAVFFVCFCYAELIDKTYYLNHYYLVSVMTFLLLFVPANRYLSLDVLRKPALKVTHVPAWTIYIFRFQLCIVYFYAGLSKLTYDWLINAMPLKIWLHAKESTPFIGPFLYPHFFSWAGALFDLSIPFLLLYKRTQKWAYGLVIIFHLLTAMLFQIGMFPYIMIASTLIFFPFYKQEEKRLLEIRMPTAVLAIWFSIQLLVPIRFLLYPGTLLWTEEGYRLSWRVMLMEKGGTTFFYVKNPATGRKFEVNNRQFLSAYQERMMETQPDMMLQYAHILHDAYEKEGIADPAVTVESYVTLNGMGSRLYIDSTVNLAHEKESWFGHKKWILPLKK